MNRIIEGLGNGKSRFHWISQRDQERAMRLVGSEAYAKILWGTEGTVRWRVMMPRARVMDAARRETGRRRAAGMSAD